MPGLHYNSNIAEPIKATLLCYIEHLEDIFLFYSFLKHYRTINEIQTPKREQNQGLRL